MASGLSRHQSENPDLCGDYPSRSQKILAFSCSLISLLFDAKDRCLRKAGGEVGGEALSPR